MKTEKSRRTVEGDGTVFDLRPLTHPLRHRETFGEFDELVPGQALVFVNDYDPSPLLSQFALLRRHR